MRGCRASKEAATLEPLIPFADWRALGPEKAADYTANRLRLDADRTRKLHAILNEFWNEAPLNLS